MIRTDRKVHRITGYLVFIQVMLWIAGGVVFSLVPFNSLVKGGAAVDLPPNPPFPSNWQTDIRGPLAEMDSISEIKSHNSSQGLLLEVRADESIQWLRLADGQSIEPPSPDSVTAYARSIYRGNGEHRSTLRLQEPEPYVMGLVDELYGRKDVWQVSYDDSPGTRLYFDGATGRYLTVRNDYWVVFDALWRLHIMDYSEGEDFNNWFLRIFSVLAAVFALSGSVLIISALKRAARKW